MGPPSGMLKFRLKLSISMERFPRAGLSVLGIECRPIVETAVEIGHEFLGRQAGQRAAGREKITFDVRSPAQRANLDIGQGVMHGRTEPERARSLAPTGRVADERIGQGGQRGCGSGMANVSY